MGFRSNGLAHGYTAFLCNEIRVHDIDRRLEDRVEEPLEGKPGDILHAAGIRRKFPAIDELNRVKPAAARDLGDKPSHLLGELGKGLERFCKLRRYHGGVDLSLIHISEPTRRTPISYAVF